MLLCICVNRKWKKLIMCSKTFSTLSLFSCPGSGSSFATAVVGGFSTGIFTHKIDRWSVFEPSFFFLYLYVHCCCCFSWSIQKCCHFWRVYIFFPNNQQQQKNNNNLVKDYEIVATIDGVKSYFFNIWGFSE